MSITSSMAEVKPATKKCTSCLKRKSIALGFYRKGTGSSAYCKLCTAKRTSAYYYANKAKMLKWQSEYAKLPHRIDRDRQLRQDPRKKQLHNKITSAWQKRNRIKANAYWKVWKAKKDGLLLKQPCEVCGNINVHAHHDDYLKPLEVRWLCIKHHEEEHHGP